MCSLYHRAFLPVKRRFLSPLGILQSTVFWQKRFSVHHTEAGNAERFIGLTMSYSIARYLKQGYLTEQEVGLDHLRRIAQNVIGSEPIPWYFSYRARIGIK